MSKAVVLPDPMIQRIEKLKTRPDEAPVDVIKRLLDYFEDDDFIDEETETAIKDALEEYKAGKSISHEDLGKKLGFI